MTRFPSADQWAAFERALDALDADQRRVVADGWSAAAQQEHASIASFSKFALELLAVGAPPSLLVSAHRAGLDEIEHARMSFKVASLCARQPLGPGPLPISPQSITQSLGLLPSAVAATLDGCLNETIAALEAGAAADGTKHEALQLVLEEIARDEQNHAELAWEYVAWAIATGGRSVRDAVETAARQGMAALEAEPEPAAGVTPAGWGLLDSRDRRVLRVRSSREVLRPAFARLIP
ncbi:MAG: hypothetical protein JNM17_31505 [Archangium sp.]|nr:hypothetical protein [Archangium sp.]